MINIQFSTPNFRFSLSDTLLGAEVLPHGEHDQLARYPFPPRTR